ncbi:hypothetical protein BJG89_04825 [Staphylococcus nepalensis]|uniref:site-specific integrase n=1 Tax=Staphylococcus TaxID=1279 RepID=UPI000BC2E445|nr:MULTISPECIES: site-specific integrase [Staphylococcus]ATH59646.1 hypothetical protein BJD96_04490 [Staphylococcus nepalensis]ATH64737.1 hypothetical protein BJG89_04825 [Staphylococcus nepalensis]NWN86679.1 site-specific integrase [Staphylococcus sp.]
MDEIHIFDNHTLHIEKNEKFSKKMIDNYRQRFEFYKRKGIIEGCQYDDRSWFLWTLKTKGTRLRISYNLDMFYNVNDALKCYTLFLMDNGLTTRTIVGKLKIIKESIFKTNFYSEEKIEEFYEYVILKIPESSKYNHITYNLEFFNFFPPKHGKKFISRLMNSDIKPYQSKTKALPPFEDILVFSNELYNFFTNAESSSTLKEKYLPLFIWWQLTMFIPMRPNEFVQLQKNDLKKVNDKYYLTIKRSKAKYPKHILPKTEFHISEDIGNLIKSYINLSEHCYTTDVSKEENSYLFPIFMRARYYTKHNKKVSKVISHGKNTHITTDMFNSLIKSFYKEIILSNDIEQLTPNSTRHLAICNMRMQNIDPLTISRMAGHASLYTQNHYANHLETFIESKVKLLSEQIKNKQMKITDFYTKEEVENLPVVQKIKTESILNRTDRNNLRQIDNGYCTDNEFPNNCVPNCLLCPFFLLDIKNRDNTLQLLEETSAYLNKQYKDLLETYHIVFQKLMNNVNKDLEDCNIPINLNEKVNNVTKSINKTIENMARTEALIIQVSEKN